MSGSHYGRVAVLMGGTSPERGISLLSGHTVHEALQRSAVDAHEVDLGRHGLCFLCRERFDRAFILMHGCPGEDGTIQGALETLGMPYTGSGILASALSMNKCVSKRIWRSLGLPTPNWMEVTAPDTLTAAAERLGLPLILKPVQSGSSLGASRVNRSGELEKAWHHARRHGDRVMAETWVEGDEYTASILQDDVLPLLRLEPAREFYDYVAKYRADDTRYHCPCGLPPEEEERLAGLALDAFRGLGARGWGRVDFILDSEGRPWLLELNTVPGMTVRSLVPMAARQAGLSFDDLAVAVLETSTLPGDTEPAGRKFE